MIILDLQQVMISNLAMMVTKNSSADLNENLLRHMILNTIRYNKGKFSEYGELVIACDSRNNWRKKIFPYYKSHRQHARDASPINWDDVFLFMDKIRKELKLYFPYRVIEVETAEADDIIATLVMEFGDTNNFPIITKMKTGKPQILILSGDKDFIQLHTYSNVKQYNPVRKTWVSHNNPEAYKRDHILKGDRGDGIPNILSEDSCFALGKRQTKLSSKKISEYLMSGTQEMSTAVKRNYDRNSMLIDLSFVPLSLQTKILAEYENESGKDKSKMFNYFIKYKLNNLMTNINDF